MNSEALFEEKVTLSPSDLSGRGFKGQKTDVIDIDTILLEKLASRLEGRCSIHGYVVPGSLTAVSRSMGYVENGRFTGDIVFHMQAAGEVLYPPDGTILEGRVEKMNAMGMFVVFEVKDKKDPESREFPAIKVILPRDLHMGESERSKEFSACEPGDRVKLEIKKSRFQVNDDFILCVGEFRGLIQEGYRNQAPAEQPPSESKGSDDDDDDDIEEAKQEGGGDDDDDEEADDTIQLN
jgi:hypothetical protein